MQNSTAAAQQNQAPWTGYRMHGFGATGDSHTHLFRVTADAEPEFLLTHLSCMLRGMHRIVEQRDDGLDGDAAWLLGEMISQAKAIADCLETPLQRAA